VFHISRRLLVLGIGLVIIGILLRQYAVQEEWRLFALDAKTGLVQWSAVVEQADNPAVSKDRVFLTTYAQENSSSGGSSQPQRKLTVFDAGSGKLLWRFTAEPRQTIETFVASPDVVAVCLSGDPQIAVLDAATGTLRGTIRRVWCPTTDAVGMTIVGHALVAITWSDDDELALQAYDTETLAVQWHTALPTQSQQAFSLSSSPLLVANDQLAVAKDGEQLDVFDSPTGAFRLSLAKNESGIELSWLRLVGSDLYLSRFVSVTAFDAETGSIRWTYEPSEQRMIAALEATPQTVYVMDAPYPSIMLNGFEAKAGNEHQIIALDANTGQEQWRKTLVEGGTLNTAALHAWASPDSDRLFATGILQGRPVLLAFAAQDGTEQWRFPLSGDFYQAPVTDGTHVLIADSAPRWRNWLTGINPAWR
jgi:outer membrane protein assembly factor BamB